MNLNNAASPVVGFRSRAWQAVLIAHIFAAAAWWWMMPHGFPMGHLRFWANTMLPLLVVVVGTLGVYSLEKGRPEFAGPVVIAIPVFWSTALMVAVLMFPVSCRRFFMPVGGIVAAAWLGYWFCWPVARVRKGAAWTTAIVAAIVGAIAPWTQRAPDATTLPVNWAVGSELAKASTPHSPLVQLSDAVQVFTAEGDVIAKCGHLRLQISPLLTFESRSPDRCWTIFAPAADRVGPRRMLVGQQTAADFVALAYQGDARHRLRVRSDVSKGVDAANACAIEVVTELDQPVFSHLNAFTNISIHGHQRLALSFSPCPSVQVDVEPFDYPVGRPARFGFLDAEGQFHLVEASSGEKGPFRELGRGPLDRTDPLVITLIDANNAVATITFADWASQASVALSPTAGWGVPMNAIEFSRSGDEPYAVAEIFLTLAATSVGRGWDSVSHSAGVYRNRITIEATTQGK